jgi:hypothetical protein
MNDECIKHFTSHPHPIRTSRIPFSSACKSCWMRMMTIGNLIDSNKGLILH